MQFRNAQVNLRDGLVPFARDEGPIEIDRGVVVCRRWVLGADAAAAAGFAFPGTARSLAREANHQPERSANHDSESISLETFLSETRPAARKMVKSKAPDEEAFIELAMEKLRRLELVDASRAHPGGNCLQRVCR